MRFAGASPDDAIYCTVILIYRHVERSAVETSRRDSTAQRLLPSEQFPRKTGEMSEMPSALNDKRGAPRVSGVASVSETDEDYFYNLPILVQ